MNASRMKVENHWRNVGRACFAKGWPLATACTGKAGIDILIREGYDVAETKAIRRRLRSARDRGTSLKW